MYRSLALLSNQTLTPPPPLPTGGAPSFRPPGPPSFQPPGGAFRPPGPPSNGSGPSPGGPPRAPGGYGPGPANGPPGQGGYGQGGYGGNAGPGYQGAGEEDYECRLMIAKLRRFGSFYLSWSAPSGVGNL
jgi:hypothetical protein